MSDDEIVVAMQIDEVRAIADSAVAIALGALMKAAPVLNEAWAIAALREALNRVEES